VLLPVAIVLVGVVAFALLQIMGTPPTRVEQPYAGPLVESVPAPPQSLQITVQGQGTVRPTTQIDLVPQVSGVIVWKSPQLEAGGQFARGQLLARIDPEDYELAVAGADAQVVRAEYLLELARGEAEAARQEWEAQGADAVGSEAGKMPDPLVLRIPQVRVAEAELKAARARLSEAGLRLERTGLRAPFDGRVRSTELDVGQFVSPGRAVARLYSIEYAEIAVPVPDEDLTWLVLPSPSASPATAAAEPQVRGPAGEDARDPGTMRVAPAAVVRGRYAGRQHEWPGRVVRLEGELDPRSRMAHVVIEVEDPYGSSPDAPLMVGMFVEVEIAGRQVDGVRSMPGSALRPGSTIWVAGPDGVLLVRPVEVLRSDGEDLLMRAEVAADERIITSRIRAVTDGMKVRLAGERPL